MNFKAVASVVMNRSVLLTEVGFSVFTLVLHGAWLATVVYAFEQGGTFEAGVVAMVVLVPGALLSPFVAVWFDRMMPSRSLAASFGLQAILLAAAALSVGAEASKFAFYALLILFVVAQMSTRPTVSSVLPRLVRDPVELAAANSVTGTVETIGLVLGPAVAGLVLYATGSVATTVATMSAGLAGAAMLALAIDDRAAESIALDDLRHPSGVWQEVLQGARLVRSDSASRNLVATLAVMRLVVGVLEVGVVVIAVEHLRQNEASAGLLGAAIGAGAVLGSALTFLMVGKRRLTLPIALGVGCASLPVALIAATTTDWLVLALLALAGFGRPFVEVGGRTLLQGLSSDDMLAQVFGLLEGLSLLMLAFGSITFSVLAATFNLRVALVVAGLAPCVAVAILFAALRRVDAGRPEIDEALFALVRKSPIFAPLAPFRLEQMLMNMKAYEWPSGSVIVRQGAHGDRLFFVERGQALVETEQGQVRIGPGGYFGEIALLRNRTRSATVRAGSNGMVAYALHGDVFLSAIATTPVSLRRSETIAALRLGE